MLSQQLESCIDLRLRLIERSVKGRIGAVSSQERLPPKRALPDI